MSNADAPIMISTVTLRVNDLPGVAAFYERILGLHRLSGDAQALTLGTADTPLLHLQSDSAARTAPVSEAGLFHTAFLLPTRGDLAAWLVNLRQAGVPLTGAADHGVSEALYLDDPEGNGIEVYVDRPRDTWEVADGRVAMVNAPIDLDALAAGAVAPWCGVPAGSVIGHVHLRVGDIGTAEAFYTQKIGFRRMAGLASAGFYAAGGYHHHLGVNVWQSAGAGQRDPGTTGLVELELSADPGALAPGHFTDPWGTEISVTPRAV
ncbi:MAG: VOC family protein [Pseudomonadota bacterium]